VASDDEPTLYELIGGKETILKVVPLLYKYVYNSEKLH